jgi:hypothetical protein
MGYRVLHILFLAIALAGIPACETSKKKQKKSVEPWVFESEKAPYRLRLRGGWTREDPATLNEFADLAVVHSDDLFFIVIPQELPMIEGVDSPDALRMKRAGLDLMETQIGDLEIQKQGPVRVDGRAGQSVVARGVIDDQEIKYVTTYVTEGDWGFQLVGWSPIDRQRELLVRIDELLAGWKFLAPKPEDDSDIQDADAGANVPDAGE